MKPRLIFLERVLVSCNACLNLVSFVIRVNTRGWRILLGFIIANEKKITNESKGKKTGEE